MRIRVKDEYLVRSFKDGRYYTVPKKEAAEFTRDLAAKQDGAAVQAALEYLDSEVLPPHWDRDTLFGLSNSSSENEDEIDSDSSDDEPREEKDRFVAQLYKYMDDRGTPLNKVPSIQNRDVDLYRLFRAVQKRGGYNRVTAQNQWKSIAIRLGFTSVTISITNLVKQAYKKFLQPYGDFHRKLGCSMLMSPRNSSRSKGRSLVRANSVASPKLGEGKDSLQHVSSTVSKLAAGNNNNGININAIANINTTINNNNNIPNTISTTTTTIAATSLNTSPNSTNIAKTTSYTAPVTTTFSSSALPSEESENTSESFQDIGKNKKKTLASGKIKTIVEKYDNKIIKDDCDVPLSKIKASAVKEKEENLIREKERERERERERECERAKEILREHERDKEKDPDIRSESGSMFRETNNTQTSSVSDTTTSSSIATFGKLNKFENL